MTDSFLVKSGNDGLFSGKISKWWAVFWENLGMMRVFCKIYK